MWDMIFDAFFWSDLIVLGLILLMICALAPGHFCTAFLDLIGWWLYIDSVFIGFVLLFNEHFAAGVLLFGATFGLSILKWYREKRQVERLESEMKSSNDWMKDR